MSEKIMIQLTDSDNTVLKPIEKKHCFFVGKFGEDTNAVFESAYEITNIEWPKNVLASYEVGERAFSDLSFFAGRTIAKARGAYQIKRHADGTIFLSMELDYPVYDPYDKMYAAHFRRVIYREDNQVVVIQAKYGHVLPKINIYVGLKESVPYLDILLTLLDNAQSLQLTQLTVLARCVAQKYHLGDTFAEKIESFIIYTCLDAANVSAAFGIFKGKKKSLTYELIKAVADYICGNCFPAWYETAPGRRYELLGELIAYIRRLKGEKSGEWTSDEKAFCHFVRKWVDPSIFVEVYTVCLIVLKFMAENEIVDVQSFNKAAASPGIFSATLMADAVEGFVGKKPEREAKKVFFSLFGTNVEKGKSSIEAAMYRYHAASNLLFRTTGALTIYSGLFGDEQASKALESEVEGIVLSAAAAAALIKREQGADNRQGAREGIQAQIDKMCESICEKYKIYFSNPGEQRSAFLKLAQIADAYLEKETAMLYQYGEKTAWEKQHEFLPENAFVRVYTCAVLLEKLIRFCVAKRELLVGYLQQDSVYEQRIISADELARLVVEAKYRFGAMSGADLLDKF